MQAFPYSSMHDCIKTTFVREGFGGFYRGVAAPTILGALAKSINFHIYEATKARFNGSSNQNQSIAGLLTGSIAGGIASGVVLGVFATPIELVKIQMQLLKVNAPISSGGNLHNGILGSVKDLGISGMYKWFPLTVMRDSFGGAVYFSAYELGKRMIDAKSAFGHFASGAAAGLAVWLVIFPIDSVKTRLQNSQLTRKTGLFDNGGAFACFLQSWRERTLYRGLSPILIRSVPVHALYFVFYEVILGFFTIRNPSFSSVEFEESLGALAKGNSQS
jgi:solute carrier family 25 carnitine/acylcarnitine transporter 20/29